MFETVAPGVPRPEPTLFFEDMTPGRVFLLGRYEMTEAEIVDFGRRFDPQYFHIDPRAALDSPFGGLIASGWHTCAAWARLWIDEVLSKADSRGSPGMEELRWLVPVRPGDMLTATVEILDARPSSRHTDRGTVMIDGTMTNQHGEVAFRLRGLGLLGRRHPTASNPARTGTDSDSEAAGRAAETVVRVRSGDGVQLDLRMMGGSGPDLLVCHATGFHGRAYAPLALYLMERFKVWALDFRGHGSSEPAPSDDYAWSSMGADTLACAEAIGAGRLYGFGHSMGGAALLLAEESQPGTFAGLLLYEPIVLPAGFFASSSGNPLAAAARNRREVFGSRAAALARYAGRPPLGALRADSLAAYVEGGFVDLPDGRVRLACRTETEARTFEGSGEMGIERAAGVDVPATVAAGSVPSEPNPAQFAPTTAATLPRGRFLGYQSPWHFGPLEAPGTVAADVIGELLDR